MGSAGEATARTRAQGPHAIHRLCVNKTSGQRDDSEDGQEDSREVSTMTLDNMKTERGRPAYMLEHARRPTLLDVSSRAAVYHGLVVETSESERTHTHTHTHTHQHCKQLTVMFQHKPNMAPLCTLPAIWFVVRI